MHACNVAVGVMMGMRYERSENFSQDDKVVDPTTP